MVFLKEFFQKVDFEKIGRQQKSVKNYPVCNELKLVPTSILYTLYLSQELTNQHREVLNFYLRPMKTKSVVPQYHMCAQKILEPFWVLINLPLICATIIHLVYIIMCSLETWNDVFTNDWDHRLNFPTM